MRRQNEEKKGSSLGKNYFMAYNLHFHQAQDRNLSTLNKF